MTATYDPELERLRYWQGQALRSQDSRDQARFDARRRQLHNRALHATGGVSFGLDVTVVPGDPARIQVDCGLAYDCYGRELVLQRTRPVRLPSKAAWLIFRLRTHAGVSVCGTAPDPGCLGSDEFLLEADVELTWIPLESFEPLDGIALAKFTGTGLSDEFRPRRARPFARPRLARGQTIRGNTPWEPWVIAWPDGRRSAVGVQTRIDTAAAGFTRTPCYFAAIDTPAWDATAEFAPLFFSHVADQTVDGFTFRLLMLQTARRRYAATAATSRVAKTSRGVGDRLEVTVDDIGPFKNGDMVALLRPRADAIVRVTDAAAAGALTLAAPLVQARPNESVLAVGSFPRMAQITSVTEASEAMIATFESTATLKKGDVLLRPADGAFAVMSSVSQVHKQVTVNTPLPNWAATDVLSVARLSSGLVTVSGATPNGSTTSVVLTPATHKVDTGLTIVLVDDAKTIVGGPRQVVNRANGTIDVSPPLTAGEIAKTGKKVAVFSTEITISKLEKKSPGMVIGVASTAPFAEGDFVAAAENTSAVAAIKSISAEDKELTLDGSIHAAEEGFVVAASWHGATTVSGLSAGTNTVVVARADAVPVGSFVARREQNDDFSKPVSVKQVSGTTVTLVDAIPGLAHLDTLAVGVFPRRVTVLNQQEQETQVQILESDAGMVTAGSHVAVFVKDASSAAVAQVVSVNAGTVVLNASLGKLTPGQQLALIHFRDTALLTAVDGSDPRSIKVDRDIAFRKGDAVGILTHYADHSNGGLIERIDGQTLTLTLPALDHGDGIVAAGWIDGGIIGPAAVRNNPSSFLFPMQFQPLLRLATFEDIKQNESAIVHGFDLLSGRPVSRSVIPNVYDNVGHAILWPSEPNAYRLRPETLSLITTFNTDFPSAFAAFAQKQQLAVSWIGCQQEFPPPGRCPGQRPHDDCPEPGSTEA